MAKTFVSNIIIDLSYNLSYKYIQFEVFESSLKWVVYTGPLLERGGVGGLLCPFSKFKEKCPNFGEKNALNRYIYG